MPFDNFHRGYEHYQQREYAQAVACFMQGLHNDWNCVHWLGHCYEHGYGIEQDLSMAKDLLLSCRDDFGTSLQKKEAPYYPRLCQRIDALQHVPDYLSLTRHIEGIGNVRVVKSPYKYEETRMRCNQDEIVVTVGNNAPFLLGIHFAQQHVPQLLREWTCDGTCRYYDNYTLQTDYFLLQVQRGTTDKYVSYIDGKRCQLFFPKNACLDYLYVQKYIHRKVKDLLFQRAKQVLPGVLQRVSERIHVPYKECEIVKSLQSYAAWNYSHGKKIALSTTCVQLPKESLEALCIHELTHNFVGGHGVEFYLKLIELGGEEAYQLDKNIWKEGKWPYLQI